MCVKQKIGYPASFSDKNKGSSGIISGGRNLTEQTENAPGFVFPLSRKTAGRFPHSFSVKQSDLPPQHETRVPEGFSTTPPSAIHLRQQAQQMTIKYTFSADQKAESLLAQAISGIRQDIASMKHSSEILSVALGGSYGRGEGGVTVDGNLYNNIDFFVVPCKTCRHLDFIKDEMDEIRLKWQAILSIDVNFYFLPSEACLHANARLLPIQELRAGHEVVFGSSSVFSSIPRIPWDQLPWREGFRLLLNAGTGILLCREKELKHEESEKDRFLIRHAFNKAALGCGDALLIARHKYSRTGLERLQALRTLSIPDELYRRYEAALQERFSPASNLLLDLTVENPIMSLLWRDSLREFVT